MALRMESRTTSDALFQALAARVPGLGVMVLRGGRVARLSASGVRSAGRADPATVADPWHIGSCTKAMTATVLARLQARGLVEPGAELGEALPGVPMHPACATLPLRAVLRHEAGLRRDPHRSVFARLRATRAPIVEQRRHIATLALAERPLAGSGYSNLGYIVLGAVIEAATGLSWERAVAREVFAPLGMQGAGTGAPPPPAPVGHVEHAGRWQARPPGPGADNPPLYGPAGRVHLPLADWARFAAVHLRAGPPGYLSPALLEEMHRAGRGGFAAGWRVEAAAGGDTVLRHTGTNTMWFADIRLMPGAGIGVAVTCNAYGPALGAHVSAFADTLLAETLATFQN